MGPRYVILVTKNEAKNEAGCYQNRIASYFNCLSGFASCNLVILKITYVLRLLFGNGSRKMDFWIAQNPEWALNFGLSPLLQVNAYFKLKNKFIFNIQQSTAALREKKERWDWPLLRDRAAHTECAMLALKLCPHLFERCFPHLFERLPNWLVVTVVMWSAANVMVRPNSIQAKSLKSGWRTTRPKIVNLLTTWIEKEEMTDVEL